MQFILSDARPLRRRRSFNNATAEHQCAPAVDTSTADISPISMSAVD